MQVNMLQTSVAAKLLLLTKLVDAFTDPMMGAIADRTRSRWGRYRPYMLFGAVPFGFFGVIVFAAPDLSPTGLLIWAYVTSDFSVVNVFQNSHSAQPLLYKITSSWGNHEGSMLLWCGLLVGR